MSKNRFFLSLFLVFLAFPIQAKTLSSIITEARVLARDTGATRPRYTDAQYTEWINQGQREFVERTWVVRKSTSFSLLAGVTYYSMPQDFHAADRVTRDYLELPEMTPAALDGRNTSWELSSGLPIYYFINLSSRVLMGFTPFPLVSTDTATIRVDYFAQASSMTATSDQSFDGNYDTQPWADGLSYYAAARACALDGRGDLAQLWIAQYNMVIAVMNEKAILRPNYRPGATGRRQ